MFSRKKILVFSLIAMSLLAFKQVDDYFEISKNLEIFSMVYKTVNSDYVDDVNPGDLMKKGIDAMLASLDPYTVYYNESQAEDAMIQQSGEYGGIGCTSRKIGEHVTIMSIRKGLPADLAGMRIGDKIVEINGKNFVGKDDDDVHQALKGAPNSIASITVDRDGKSLQLQVERQEIKIKNVTYFGVIGNDVGYIRLDHFMMGAGTEVKEALVNLKKQGIKSVVLDLRDNGGGLLHEAVNIVNTFIDNDKLVVVSKGRSSDAYREYKTLNSVTDPTIPLVVLVNDRSASASEIVCGAIQDFDRGVIIGRNTFGKGLVQNVKPLGYRTQMKVTIAKYYIPSGRCIQLLDYGKRDANGKPSIMPDSLRKKFKTKNGRTVLDGGGVKPDLMIELNKVPSILESLENSFIIYDFANAYRAKNEKIDLNTFNIDDVIYEDFKKYAASKTFTHLNASENALKALKERLKSDNYDKGLVLEIEQLEKGLNKLKMVEMETYKKEIVSKLRVEIAKRFYYEEAVFLISFKHDPDVLKAVDVLNNQPEYRTILNIK